jgi:hypothetical protein
MGHRILALLAALTLLAACNGKRGASDPNGFGPSTWGPVCNGLRCRIKPVNSESKIGEHWYVSCTVENTAAAPVAVYLKSITHFWAVEVTGPKASKHQLPPGPGPATDSGFVELPPRGSFSFEWSPSRGNGGHRWSLDAPGEYTVSAVYRVKKEWLHEFAQYGLNPEGKWTGELRSNAAAITVVEAEGSR